MRINRFFQVSALVGAILMFTGCKKEASRSTGWEYNNPKNGGFEKPDFVDQETGPGLVFVEGGTFTMGNTQDDVMFEWNNSPRRITVSSFYMDETEVRNLDYLEYLYWLSRVYVTYPYVYRKALPDSLVWRQKLAYNEPFVEYYLRHPAYRNYPVVGVSWDQASAYCSWRTDRVNEMLLIRRGILNVNPNQSDGDNFNTEAYLAGQYDGLPTDKQRQDLNPNGSGTRKVKMEDGILLPKYRLPTEAEWEYAALGLIGNTLYERVVERKNYPWNGSQVRTNESRYYGSFMDNFKRGKGDYMGVAGNLNDGADIPAACGSFFPNDYGLYNMAGNVSEWVMDVYRPLNSYDVADLRPFRGNVFQKLVVQPGPDNILADKDSLGHMQYEDVTIKDAVDRRNYRQADNINFLDGDFASNIDNNDWANPPSDTSATGLMYEYGRTSMISDHARVYKGGNWKDQAFYMSPSTRRYLEQTEASDAIGFRCAMTRVGGSIAGK